MDWTGCNVVEAVPGRLGGVPVIRGTRVAADTVVECAQLGETAGQIAFDYDLKLDDVRLVLAYAAEHKPVSTR